MPNKLQFAFCILLLLTTCASAQQRIHSGQITKSFTEPIEQSIAASAEVGIIVQSFVKEGDQVRVGDTLAKVNQSVQEQALIIAQARAKSTARLDSAKSQLELIDSQLDAIKSLVDGGHTNRYEVQQKQAEYQQAYAEFRLAEDDAKLNQLEVGRIAAQIKDRTITSPINGIVTEIHKQLGENVSNNEPQYATIVRVDELKVRFYLDASTLQASRVGQEITISVGTNRKRTPARVVYVSPIIDPDSGLGRLDVVLDNSARSIQCGIICFWNEREVTRVAKQQ